jgi:hypothetical protein
MQLLLDQEIYASGLEDADLAMGFVLDEAPAHALNPFDDRRAFYHRRDIPATKNTAVLADSRVPRRSEAEKPVFA